MNLQLFLIIFPVIAALALFVIKSNKVRKLIVWVNGSVIALGSLAVVIHNFGTDYVSYEASSLVVDYLGVAVSLAIAAIIIYFAVRYKNVLAGVLATIQVIGSLIFDFGFAHNITVSNGLYIDSLSVIMTFIIGVIGSAICIYAIGYMDDFQEHAKEGEKDRRNVFFALMFLFLSAMFIIIYSDNMSWLFAGWEITTVCSFLLIGYTRTEEAIRNSFRQIIMNLVGGIAFLIAMFVCAGFFETLSLQEFINTGLSVASSGYGYMLYAPLICFAIAGMTKAAQMPFHTWLLGAMVAPTPTSALLHSSTMVKAGVFLLIKIAPLFLFCTAPALLVMMIGGVTFLVCSVLAITQSNAKRVLAYSTIANLGLITACAGVGTPEAIWAATFLVIFHACAKSLLFMCVGTAEHHIGSRNIEDMDLLFERMPKLAACMIVGILAMFIAPFGMLVSKWAALASFATGEHFVLILLLAFGSAATFVFWGKWLGKLTGMAGSHENIEMTVHKSEWTALLLALVLTLLFTLALPLISSSIVIPYLADAYSMITFGGLSLSESFAGLSSDNLWICSVIALLVYALFMGIAWRKSPKKGTVYMSGVLTEENERGFRNSLGGTSYATARNWYMEDTFNEKKITNVVTILTVGVIILGFVVSFYCVFMML